VTGGSRVLLAGDASARPVGLERALSRAGFVLTEAPPSNGDLEPDAILVTLASTGQLDQRTLAGGRPDSPPVVVVIGTPDPDAPAAALALGADDALAAPIHLPELCARLHARIRDRQCPRGTTREGAVRRSLDGLVGEARLTLRPDEVVLALVRRLARAFDLVSCAFLAVGPDGGEARMVAEAGQGPVSLDGESRLDPGAHAAIAEAVRTRRVAAFPGGRATVVPALADGRLLGVLVIQRREVHPGLGSAQLQFAESLAEAAARALDSVGAGSNGNGATPVHRSGPAPADQSLDRRLQEEFERARRYSLSFSLVLLDLGARTGDGDETAADSDRLRQALRLPDFVARYGGGELAILLPETGLDGARRSLARLRERIWPQPADPSVEDPAFSAGIVTYPHPAVTQADDMFALVEAALARGKAQIGERVGVAD
jgi:diguanylate cyclase (GGDEF)-like protein